METITQGKREHSSKRDTLESFLRTSSFGDKSGFHYKVQESWILLESCSNLKMKKKRLNILFYGKNRKFEKNNFAHF